MWCEARDLLSICVADAIQCSESNYHEQEDGQSRSERSQRRNGGEGRSHHSQIVEQTSIGGSANVVGVCKESDGKTPNVDGNDAARRDDEQLIPRPMLEGPVRPIWSEERLATAIWREVLARGQGTLCLLSHPNISFYSPWLVGGWHAKTQPRPRKLVAVH